VSIACYDQHARKQDDRKTEKKLAAANSFIADMSYGWMACLCGGDEFDCLALCKRIVQHPSKPRRDSNFIAGYELRRVSGAEYSEIWHFVPRSMEKH
jgi:hypothetical protein